jgi:hypothetical protein
MTRRALIKTASAIAFALASSSTPATQDTRQLALSQQIHQLFELSPAAPQDVFTLPLGVTSGLTLDVTSKVAAVNVEILTPSGLPLDPALIERFTVEPGQAPPLSALLFEEGFHVQTSISSPAPGTWTVRVTLPPGTPEAYGNISAFITGGMSAGVTMSRPRYQAGDTPVVGLVAFKDGAPVVGAIATAEVYTAGFEKTPRVVSLLDDGQNEDATAGDGIYSAGIAGLTPGHYLVNATVQLGADRAAGATNFDVTTALARFAGTKSDAGIDVNADGLFDWIGVDIGVSVDTPGTYEVFASMRSPASSTELTAAARAALGAGPQSIQVRFAAADIRTTLATNGPWEIFDVRLIPTGVDGISTFVLADRIADLGVTGAYTLAQLQRPISQILAGITERGLDTNGNGLFDLLETTFQIDTLRAGSYTWTGTLRSIDGNPLSVASGQGTLQAGITRVGFAFDAKPIGASGIDGPYGLFDVAIYGPAGAAALLAKVGQTQAYRATQFEGSQVTFDRLIELVSSVVIGGRGGVPVTTGIRNSLIQKLTNGKDQADGGQIQAALGMLGAFVNELQALPAERVSANDKQRLIDFAARLQVRLQNPQ